MTKKWWWKTFSIVVLFLAAIVYLLPSIMGTDKMPVWFKDKINKGFKLGLDLQGGIHMVLGVDIDKAVRDKIDLTVNEMKEVLNAEKIKFSQVTVKRGQSKLSLTFPDQDNLDKFKSEIINQDSRFQIDLTRGMEVIVSMVPEFIDKISKNAVEQTIKTLRNRIDQFGVSEPTIQKRGDNQVLVQLPGVEDPDRAKNLLGRTAQLEFKIVEDEVDFIKKIKKEELPKGIKLDYYTYSGKDDRQITEAFLQGTDKKAIQDFLKDKIPDTHQVAYQKEEKNLKVSYRTYIFKNRADLTGDYLVNAEVLINQERNQPYVSLEFDKAGSKLFAKVTGDNVKRRMAIVLDGIVDSAPVINERIPHGRAQITLGSLKSYQELLKDAQDMAIVLKAGALPAPIEILEERTVGPTLGMDSIEKGTRSIMIGAIIVLIFMVIYYKMAGMIANLALALNLVFIMAILAGFEATLTLPGLAGIVLTLGMAVDANVIIFERLREEMRSDKPPPPQTVVNNGFSKAFTAIFDANITTLIAGIVLYQYGSGPIRGFAVTLCIGIISSMFTALVVTRLVFELIASSKRVKRLSI